MAWRIRWRQGKEERHHTLMRERVVLWTDESGRVGLESTQGAWEWATLVESSDTGPVIRWHHPPVDVAWSRQGASQDVGKSQEKEWRLEPGDELIFDGRDVAIEIVATSASVKEGLEFIEAPGNGEEVEDETLRRMWKLHTNLARGAGWEMLLEELGGQARSLFDVGSLEGIAVLIWEGEQEFFHRVIWPEERDDEQEPDGGRRRPGALASLLTRDGRLKCALRERGEVVIRRYGDESFDLLMPICDDEFLGAFYLVGDSPAPVEPTEIWSLVHLFEPAAVQLIRRYRSGQKVRNFEEENRYFRERERRHYLFKDLVCESEVMREVYDDLHERVDGETPLLMTGEAGTGKELLARALHHLGGRQEQMLIRMGCAEFPRELVGFELFGCVASELTGAVAARKGIFELAEGGTVFLDEIDRLSPMVQGKLVRVLKEQEVRRIGDAVGRPVNTRFIASSHRDLKKLSEQGQFRRDLFDLLSPYQLEVPPLRSRRDDILPLARIFLKKFADRYDAACRAMDDELRRWLVSYPWPGNVRQLQTFMEAAVLMARDKEMIERQELILERVEKNTTPA